MSSKGNCSAGRCLGLIVPRVLVVPLQLLTTTSVAPFHDGFACLCTVSLELRIGGKISFSRGKLNVFVASWYENGEELRETWKELAFIYTVYP